MRRFFYNEPNQLAAAKTLPVTADIFHHWCKVLRAQTGEQAVFFDGQGGEYTVTLTEIGKKTAMVQVNAFEAIDRRLPFEVDIGLVMSRGERMDYAIQKATELGVTTIHLLTSQHGEVRLKPEQADKKTAHWQQVAISACEQCGLNIPPTILPPIPLEQWINNCEVPCEPSPPSLAAHSQKQGLQKLVLAVPKTIDDPFVANHNALSTIQQTLINKNRVKFVLLIGAEGGLSETEIALALAAGFLPWQIGERVLRTVTAPVVALSCLLTVYQLYFNP